MSKICPLCSYPVGFNDNFCSKCGHKIQILEVPLTLGKKISIYVFSFVFAPLGLYWFFKFLKSTDADKRKVAFIVLFITVATIATAVVLSAEFYKSLNQYMESSVLNMEL